MSDRKNIPFLRLVKDMPDPLALYIRAAHNDHRVLSDYLANGYKACSGIVINALYDEAHSELREQILKTNLDAILDPRTQQSATLGGYTSNMSDLPWGKDRPHTHTDFEGVNARRLVSSLSEFAINSGYTQIIAPTHLISSANDPWHKLDIKTVRLLKNYLDRRNASNVQIIYELTTTYKTFRDKQQRIRIINTLRGLPINSLWLKIDGIGRNSSSLAAQNYISACNDFHSLNIPVVADHVGGVIGLSLLSFGAVGGIAHGVTLNERFNANGWSRPRRKGRFGAPKTVYISAIDAMLKVKDAESLLEKAPRSRSIFTCNDTRCCRRGQKDMLQNPSRHFLVQRSKEISNLSNIPETLRHQRFLDKHLRNATDKALMIANVAWDDSKFSKKIQDNRKRLDSLRTGLGHYAEKNPPQSFSLHPKTRLVHG